MLHPLLLFHLHLWSVDLPEFVQTGERRKRKKKKRERGGGRREKKRKEKEKGETLQTFGNSRLDGNVGTPEKEARHEHCLCPEGTE